MELLTEKVRWYDKRRLAGQTFWQGTWCFAITTCKTSIGIKIKIKIKIKMKMTQAAFCGAYIKSNIGVMPLSLSMNNTNLIDYRSYNPS